MNPVSRIRAPPTRRTSVPRRAVAEPPGPTSPLADTDSSNWRDNPFARYCDDAMAIPEVAEGLRVLEQTHPEIDGNVVLFAVWRATRGGDVAPMSHATLRKATKISERWRWRVGDGLHRVEASLRGPDLAESPPAVGLANAVAALGDEVRDVARAALFDLARGEAWWSDDINTNADDAARPEYSSGKATVKGSTAVASANLRMYLLEYLGARFIANEWRRLRGVVDGCLAAGGVDISDDVIGVECGDSQTRGMTDEAWKAVRGCVDPTMNKPRRDRQGEANRRYVDARRNLQEANALWKATCEDYRRARRTVKHARHEVHKSRKAVRVEFW